MRYRSMLALGLAVALLPLPPAHTAPASTSKRSKKEAPATLLRGIETLRIGNGVVKTDKTGKGAVLCIWGIYEAIKAVGQQCYNGQDAPFQAELDRSLDLIDKFIIKNGPATRAELEARLSLGLQELHSSGNICVGEGVKMYEVIRGQGPLKLHAGTIDLLSIPREPVMNPCL